MCPFEDHAQHDLAGDVTRATTRSGRWCYSCYDTIWPVMLLVFQHDLVGDVTRAIKYNNWDTRIFNAADQMTELVELWETDWIM